jgi:hypothetical protein
MATPMSETPIFSELWNRWGEGEDGHPLTWDMAWTAFSWLPPKRRIKQDTRKRETLKQ